MVLAQVTLLEDLTISVMRVFESFIAYTPKLLAALLLILIGLLTAFVLRFLVRRLINYALGQLKRHVDMSSSVQLHPIYQSLPKIVSGILFWIVLLFFLAAGIEALGLDAVSALFGSITIYLPRVLGVAMIIFAGLILGDMARVWVTKIAEHSRSGLSETLGRATQVVIWLVALLMSIDQLGIHSGVIFVLLAIVGGSLFGAGALAFGLGAQSTVSNIIAAHYVHQTYQVGNHVRIGERQGCITEITRVAIVLATDEGRLVVPACHFHQSVSLMMDEGG
ncbi:MAG: mechanosensitive ion channel [Phycisphaeraceae bacterium]